MKQRRRGDLLKDGVPGGLWHLGLVAPNYGPSLSVAGLRAAAAAAEIAGFDSFWVTDHVAVPTAMSATYGRISEALVTAAYLAAVTQRIDIGVSALVVPQRPTLLTLKQVMSVQLLAEGRLTIAVAAGWTEQEFHNLGASMRTRAGAIARWEALIEAVEAQGEGRIDLTLPGLDLQDAFLAPGFVDGAPPGMWMAGHAAAVIRRAARVGVWHPVGRSHDLIGRLSEDLRKLREDAHVVLRVTVVFRDRADTAALDDGGRCQLVGPAEFVAQQLQRFRAVGCDGFVVDLLRGDGTEEERVDEFCANVVPNLTDQKTS